MRFLAGLSVSALALLVPSGALAASYYVATNGDDAADGSQATPWQTLQHAADTVTAAFVCGDFSDDAMSAYETGWRERLADEVDAQLSLRRVAERLTDAEIDSLFELARIDGIMPIVRRTARFNRHRDLILALFKHPPVRRILFQALTG